MILTNSSFVTTKYLSGMACWRLGSPPDCLLDLREREIERERERDRERRTEGGMSERETGREAGSCMHERLT